MRTLLNFISRIFSNSLAQTFILLHLIILVSIYFFKPAQKGFAYHYFEEPFYYQLLMTIDSPSVLLAGLIFYPLYSQYTDSWWVIGFYYFVLLFLTSIQWALIGYIIWKIWKFITKDKMK